MTSRRLIRIKVIQLLYAYNNREAMNLFEIERDLKKSIEKSYDLYYQTLMLMTKIQDFAFLKNDQKKFKLLATAEDLNPNMKFCNNAVLNIIKNNKSFLTYIRNHKISWNDNTESVEYFYKSLTDSDIYRRYMEDPEMSFEKEREFVLKFFYHIIAEDKLFYEIMEDKSIYWNDDFELVLSMLYKTLKNIEADALPEDRIFINIFQSEEDMEFANELLTKTLLNHSKNIEILIPLIKNWEIDRISELDRIIMSAAVTEFKFFPSIPIKVTLDEYIEIAKSYSTPKSGSFINGVLDKTVRQLNDNDEIHKSGRGLME